MRRRTFLRLTSAAASASVLAWGGAARAFGDVSAAVARIVIVGGGFAGSTCALALRHLNPAIHVTLVDPQPRYVTCPMSNSALVGLRDLQSITVSRRGLERAGVHFVVDRVGAIDSRRRVAQLQGGAVLAYDRLVLAAGIRFLWGEPQGYSQDTAQHMPHAWQAGVQTEILRKQLRAIRNGGVVAISVPSGPMRCPPAPFERASLIAGFLQQHKPRCKILIFDSNNHFPKQDVFTDAWAQLYSGMIEWIPITEGGAVVRIDSARRTLYTSHGAHRVDVANIIPPQAPAALAAAAGLASERGWCPVSQNSFESTLVPNVHVIGDACIADPMPKSASAANSQGRQCAQAISAALAGRELASPILHSVCYSLLARNRALSIHGRFRFADGAIRQLPALDEPSVAAQPSREAASAQLWYETIVRDSFGT